MGYDYKPRDPRNDDDDHKYGDDPKVEATNIDVDIKQDMDIDLETSHDNSTEVDYKLDLEGLPYDDVKVDVEIETSDSHTYTETVDIEFTETVDKTVTVETSTWDVDVDVKASNIVQDVVYENDAVDIDLTPVIDVAADAKAELDDITVDMSALYDSFNGEGNDLQFDINQTNDVSDEDEVTDTTAFYGNLQLPDAKAEVDYGHKEVEAKGGSAVFYESEDEGSKGYGHKDHGRGGQSGSETSFGAIGWWGAEASQTSLWGELELGAPDDAFQTVSAEGGKASSDDGIDDSTITDADGNVEGLAQATADAVVTAEALVNNISTGGNTVANVAEVSIVGDDATEVGDGATASVPSSSALRGGEHDDHGDHGGKVGDEDGGTAIRDVLYDEDGIDIDSSKLINVDGDLEMDDFSFDLTAIANSFTGAGNDMQFDVNQANDLIDNDTASGTSTGYLGAGWNGAFQDISAEGGDAFAGDGINNSSTSATDGVFGTASASADAVITASALTNNLVMGANTVVNMFSADIIGGDSFSADDLAG